jgi:hypothetical protein
VLHVRQPAPACRGGVRGPKMICFECFSSTCRGLAGRNRNSYGGASPAFVWGLLALANFMRSRPAGTAHVDLFAAMCRKPGSPVVFAPPELCQPRTLGPGERVFKPRENTSLDKFRAKQAAEKLMFFSCGSPVGAPCFSRGERRFSVAGRVALQSIRALALVAVRPIPRALQVAGHPLLGLGPGLQAAKKLALYQGTTLVGP